MSAVLITSVGLSAATHVQAAPVAPASPVMPLTQGSEGCNPGRGDDGPANNRWDGWEHTDGSNTIGGAQAQILNYSPYVVPGTGGRFVSAWSMLAVAGVSTQYAQVGWLEVAGNVNNSGRTNWFQYNNGGGGVSQFAPYTPLGSSPWYTLLYQYGGHQFTGLINNTLNPQFYIDGLNWVPNEAFISGETMGEGDQMPGDVGTHETVRNSQYWDTETGGTGWHSMNGNTGGSLTIITGKPSANVDWYGYAFGPTPATDLDLWDRGCPINVPLPHASAFSTKSGYPYNDVFTNTVQHGEQHYYENPTWGEETVPPSPTTYTLGNPSAVGANSTRMDDFVRGTDNHLYHIAYTLPSPGWSAWEDVTAIVGNQYLISDPSAVVVDGSIEVFGRLPDNHVGHWHMQGSTGAWTWEEFTSAQPLAAVGTATAMCFTQCATGAGVWKAVWHAADGGVWLESGGQGSPTGGEVPSTSVLASSFDVFPTFSGDGLTFHILYTDASGNMDDADCVVTSCTSWSLQRLDSVAPSHVAVLPENPTSIVNLGTVYLWYTGVDGGLHGLYELSGHGWGTYTVPTLSQPIDPTSSPETVGSSSGNNQAIDVFYRGANDQRLYTDHYQTGSGWVNSVVGSYTFPWVSKTKP